MSDIDLETLQQNLLISFREIAILLTNQDKKKYFLLSFENWLIVKKKNDSFANFSLECNQKF